MWIHTENTEEQIITSFQIFHMFLHKRNETFQCFCVDIEGLHHLIQLFVFSTSILAVLLTFNAALFLH